MIMEIYVINLGGASSLKFYLDEIKDGNPVLTKNQIIALLTESVERAIL